MFTLKRMQYVRYDARFKRKVILFAEEYGNRFAERQFGVSEMNVRRWRTNRDRFFACDLFILEEKINSVNRL